MAQREKKRCDRKGRESAGLMKRQSSAGGFCTPQRFYNPEAECASSVEELDGIQLFC